MSDSNTSSEREREREREPHFGGVVVGVAVMAAGGRISLGGLRALHPLRSVPTRTLRCSSVARGGSDEWTADKRVGCATVVSACDRGGEGVGGVVPRVAGGGAVVNQRLVASGSSAVTMAWPTPLRALSSKAGANGASFSACSCLTHTHSHHLNVNHHACAKPLTHSPK